MNFCGIKNGENLKKGLWLERGRQVSQWLQLIRADLIKHENC